MLPKIGDYERRAIQRVKRTSALPDEQTQTSARAANGSRGGTPNRDAVLAAAAALLGLVAVAAIDGPVAARLEGDGGLLATAGADHCGGLCLGTLVSTAASASLTVLSGLPAVLATPGRGVATFLKEGLVGACEGEFLTAVATGKLLISRHGGNLVSVYANHPLFPGIRKLQWGRQGVAAAETRRFPTRRSRAV